MIRTMLNDQPGHPPEGPVEAHPVDPGERMASAEHGHGPEVAVAKGRRLMARNQPPDAGGDMSPGLDRDGGELGEGVTVLVGLGEVIDDEHLRVTGWPERGVHR